MNRKMFYLVLNTLQGKLKKIETVDTLSLPLKGGKDTRKIATMTTIFESGGNGTVF